MPATIETPVAGQFTGRYLTLEAVKRDITPMESALHGLGIDGIPRHTVRCPFSDHIDCNPSFSIYQNAEGFWCYKCFGCQRTGTAIDLIALARGCDPTDVIRDLVGGNGRYRDAKPAAPANKPEGVFQCPEELAGAVSKNVGLPVERVHKYTNPETGEIDAIVVRCRKPGEDRKEIRPGKPHNGGFVFGAPDTPRPLYNRSRIREYPNEILIIGEGETVVEAATWIGLLATTNIGGSNAAKKADWTPVSGRNTVAIWRDNDLPGEQWARDVHECLCKLPDPPKKILRIDPAKLGLPEKGDLVDFIDMRAGASKDEIRAEILQIIDGAQELPKIEFPADDEPDDELVIDEPQWPGPIDERAFHGLAGEIVGMIEPHSEADPVALLAQFLVAFGNCAGRNPHRKVESTRHGTNLFGVLVGPTAAARKGTSLDHIIGLFERADPDWRENCVVHGLSSGEGLKWNVRDEIKNAKGAVTDSGIEDKRLQVIESEFGTVLRVLERTGNTLSPVLRAAWDGNTLRTLTKNDPVVATDPHISIIAHVTAEELREKVANVDCSNGFVNRFLFFCVRRSKCLPFGGSLTDGALARFVLQIHEALKFARMLDRPIGIDSDARSLWAQVYPDLSTGRSGLLGVATARAEAQVLRLSSLYGLLDLSPVIRDEHLQAALAIWDYAFESARFVFSDKTGNTIADSIAQALKVNQHGLSRTEIHNHLGRHSSEREISAALHSLLRRGSVRSENRQTGGRPVTVWKAARTGCEISELSEQRV